MKITAQPHFPKGEKMKCGIVAYLFVTVVLLVAINPAQAQSTSTSIAFVSAENGKTDLAEKPVKTSSSTAKKPIQHSATNTRLNSPSEHLPITCDCIRINGQFHCHCEEIQNPPQSVRILGTITGTTCANGQNRNSQGVCPIMPYCPHQLNINEWTNFTKIDPVTKLAQYQIDMTQTVNGLRCHWMFEGKD